MMDFYETLFAKKLSGGGSGGSGMVDITSQCTFVKGTNIDFMVVTDGTYILGYGHVTPYDDGRRNSVRITLPYAFTGTASDYGATQVVTNSNDVTMYTQGSSNQYVFLFGEVDS